MVVSRVARGLVLVLLAAVLAVCLTWPLAPKFDRVGRLNTADGHWSLWCITWVSHILTSRPASLFHANIFYPHRYALAYSEANIVPGLLGVPAWLATQNPYATHNTAVLLGFVFSFLTAYALAHYLTRHTAASVACGIAFAYCPFIFARTAHIQLLMTFGLPWALLMMHRLIDRPTIGRGIALGLTLVVQALACAYYGIFAGLSVGLGVLCYAWMRRCWTNLAYWGSIAVAAGVSIAVVAPFFSPYLFVQQELGFARTIEDANMYSADAGAWLASSAWAHRWMLPRLQEFGGWNEVLFPGFLTTILGVTGLVIGLRLRRETAVAAADTDTRSGEPSPSRLREAAIFYGLLGAISFWTSFGPPAGLYTAMYYTIPVFSFLRAPARVGIMVALVLSVSMAIGVSRLLRARPPRVAYVLGILLAVALAAELAAVPLRMNEAPPVNQAYRLLANLPRGPVAEFPFFYERNDFPRHAQYMLASTAHWRPLINGYSDHIPEDFRDMVRPLSSFPSREAFGILRQHRTRYVIFHLGLYDRRSRERVLRQIEAYQSFLTPLSRENDVWLFAISAWP